jgi:phytoene dehydrogenase-like protein
MMDRNLSARTVIMGGGPSSLNAAYKLARQDRTPVVLESDEVAAGTRTVAYQGFLFDSGGHRFEVIDPALTASQAPPGFVVRPDRQSLPVGVAQP